MCARDEKLCLREKVAFFFCQHWQYSRDHIDRRLSAYFYTDVVGMDAAAVGTLF